MRPLQSLIDRWTEDRYTALAYGFALATLITLLGLSTYHEIGGYGVETDFYGAFAPGAEALLHGKVDLDPGYGPGYELALIAFYPLFFDFFAAGKLISILSLFCLGVIVFKLVARLYDSELAFFALLPTTLVFLPWALVASTDVFFAFLFMACLYLLIKDKRIDRSHLLWSGLLAGFIYITRNNGIAVFASVGFLLLFINPAGKELRGRLFDLAVFLGWAMLIIVPWLVTNQLVNHDALRSDSYLIIASHFYGRPGVVVAEDMKLSAAKFHSLSDVIFYDFRHFVFHYIANLYRHFRDVLLHSIKLPLGLFVVPGLLLAIRKIDRWQMSFVTFPVFGFLVLCLVHYEPRYYLYIISFFTFAAAFFFFGKWDGERRRDVFYYLVRIVYGFALLALLYQSSQEIRTNLTSEPLALRAAAERLTQVASPDDIIIARKPHVGYLSHLKTVYFPQVDSLPALRTFARESNASYVLVSPIERRRRPRLSRALAPGLLPDWLRPVYVSGDSSLVVLKVSAP